MKEYELKPVGEQKSFYGKAIVKVDAEGSTLFSYGKPIIRMNQDVEFTKLWDGWSATTGEHIKAFCGLNKEEFDALEYCVTEKVCSECGCFHENMTEIDGKCYCESCFNDIYTWCGRCRSLTRKDEIKEVSGIKLCNDCYEKYVSTCEDCGRKYLNYGCEEYLLAETGEYVHLCRDCVDSRYTQCDDCGELHSNDDLSNIDTYDTVNGRTLYLCDDCRENYTPCEDCGLLCNDSDIYSYTLTNGEQIFLCDYCREDHYMRCDGCNGLIDTENDDYHSDGCNYYCESCYEENGLIHDYCYKPEPTFYGQDSRFYYGVELEIDKGGEDSDNAKEILSIANRHQEVLYTKHDGSIDDGFEMVSEPATLKYHKTEFEWEEVLQEAVILGYRSHDTSTCGLHVHVSRNAFGQTVDEQEDAIARIVHFVENNWNELVKFTRRTEYSLNRWAARYCTISTEVKETYKKAKERNLGRYVAVNLANSNTVEFRLFRGTLRYQTFIATLELVDEICNIANCSSDKQIESMTWNDFVAGIDKEEKPNLVEYLKSKRLYVNEIVENYEEEM